MIVMKFGGTSVKNAAMMKQVASILGMYNGQVLVVLSATSGTTDTLYKLITLSQEGQLNESIKLSKLLKNKHFMIMNELGLENDPDLTRILNELFSELSLYLRGISYLKESSNKVRDAVASTGELISTHIFSAYLKKIYPKSIWFDARKVLRTNNQFGSAIPDMKKIPELCKEKLLPAFLKNRFVITQGFIGSTEDGITTTLGRGGSDYSASIFGFAMDAEAIQIWTDISGVLSADPKIIPDAFSQSDISFKEAAELAFFGAKVLHPSTILPAIGKNIPVLVKNTWKPEDPGTVILRECKRPGEVKTVAYRKNITTITIESSRMLLAFGFMERIFDVFARFGTSVDLVSTSEISVSITLDKTEDLDAIVAELQSFSTVRISSQKVIVSLVGENIKNSPHFLKKAFEALDGIPIDMISFGASNVNLSVVIPEAHFEESVKSLHKTFFGSNGLEV